MQPAFGRNDPMFNRGYEDGYKWGRYDYNCCPGPEYDAGFMAGYFKREGKPFDGETYTQQEEARKRTQYQNNAWDAQKIFGDANPLTIQTTAIIKAIVFLIIFGIISSVSSFFDSHKNSNKINSNINNNSQQEELVYSESAKKQLLSESIVEKNHVNLANETTTTFNPSDLRDYVEELQNRIKRNWRPEESAKNKAVEVDIKVAKDGSLLSYQITNSSGLREVDKSVVDAILLTTPFEPLPEGFNEDSINIKLTFDYHKIN